MKSYYVRDVVKSHNLNDPEKKEYEIALTTAGMEKELQGMKYTHLNNTASISATTMSPTAIARPHARAPSRMPANRVGLKAGVGPMRAASGGQPSRSVCTTLLTQLSKM